MFRPVVANRFAIGLLVSFFLMRAAAAVAAQSLSTQKRCIFEVPATTYAESKQWVQQLRNAGAHISVVASPSVMLGSGTDDALSKIRQLGARTLLQNSPNTLAKLPNAAEAAVFRVLNEIPPALNPAHTEIAAAVPEENGISSEEFEAAGLSSRAGELNWASPGTVESGAYDGFTDFMLGDIALGVVLFESDGTIDSNIFSWTSQEVDTVVTRLTVVLDMFSAKALTYTHELTWYLIVFQPTDARMQVPWQNHMHLPNINFAWDTIPAKIYSNFGIDTVASGDFWKQGVLGPRALEFNKYLADSVGAQTATHHFVGHATTVCGLPPSAGWYSTAIPGKATYYAFWESGPYAGDSCLVNWPMPALQFISHEMLHSFGNRLEEYGTDCPYPDNCGDKYEVDGHVSRTNPYNKWGCHLDSTFHFPSCIMFSGTAPFDSICPATARMVGWWGPDYGDAPPPYPTKKSNNGARHLTGGFEWLGKKTSANGYGSVTFENDADSASPDFIDRDGASNLAAAGGDAKDDGVYFTAVLNPGALDTLEVIMSNHGEGDLRYMDRDTTRIYLNAWIDWNGDKDWTDNGEHFLDSYAWVPASASDLSDTVIFTFTPPANYADTIWARFRLDYGEDCGTYHMIYSDSTLNGPVGPAIWGEVEDYKIITGLSVTWLRGDLDGNHVVNTADLVTLNKYVFSNGPTPVPREGANLNCDGVPDVFDVMAMIYYLYYNTPFPCQP